MTWLNGNDTVVNALLKPNELLSVKRAVKLPQDIAVTNPYWLAAPHTPGLFVVRDRSLIGKPENDPALVALFNMEISGVSFAVRRPVVYKSADPAKGEIYRALEILPPVTVNLAQKAYVFVNDQPKTIQVMVHANADNVKGTLDVTVPSGWSYKLSDSNFVLAKKNDEVVIEIIVSATRVGSGTINVGATVDGKHYNQSIQRIDYAHVPEQFFLFDAAAALQRFDLKTGGTNIGYIPGAGDDVAAALRQAGYTVTELDDAQLANSDLSRYDAIVTGVRAYNTNERLQVHYNRLMDYVKNGGNLVVQYNTNNRIGPLKANIGPYPFTISRDRVTNEQAEVRITNPSHSAVNQPNKLSQVDFENWIQERSIYQATELDSSYTTVFSMNDPNEKPSGGSLIIAPYCKGNFVYTGLVFFRQLPAGNPGAFRLFANLLALPKRS
jgi:hypothetical protein